MTDGVVCPECGARSRTGTRCEDLFHALLAQHSLTDRTAYSLAIACYTLQHPARQVEPSLAWAYCQVMAAVQADLPLTGLDAQTRSRFDQPHERTAPRGLRRALEGQVWRTTIGDLERLAGSSQGEAILVWARHVSADIQNSLPRT